MKLQLAVFMAVFMGWQVFHDGSLAYYIACGLLVAVLCVQLAWHKRTRQWAAVLGYGALSGLTTSGCGALFASKADGFSFLCDKGTGLPISIISAGMAALVCLYLVAGEKQ